MSRDQLPHKSQRLENPLERWNVKDTSNDGAIVDGPDTLRKKQKVDGVSTMNRSCPSKGVTIVIDDDNDDGLTGNCVEDGIIIESDASSTEDCIVECLHNKVHHVSHRARKPPFRLAKCQELYRKGRSARHSSGSEHVSLVSSSDSDSDCELLGSSLRIRAEWEKAALRKQKLKGSQNSQFGVEDQVSGSGSNTDPKAFSCETSVNNVDVESDNAYDSEDQNSAELLDCSNSNNAVHNGEGDNMSSCAATTDGIIEENHPQPAENEAITSSTCQLSGSAVQGSLFDQVDAGQVNHEPVKERAPGEQTPCSTHLQHAPLAKSSRVDFEDEVGSLGIKGELRGEREKLKETAAYKLADQEEWESRHRELQLQAEEAQRLKKRKKAETLRLLDMERRQKQRLEEVRETQKKDEETMNLKEQYRVEVRRKLNRYELMYTDMASLLHGLGIQVGGSPCPMPDEVNAAYKRALIKFHPDRASRGDIRQQIEAEETFKMISRLKDKLPLTVNYLFPTSRSRW